MRSETTPTPHCNHMNRRGFLRMAGVAAAVGLLSTSTVGHLAFAAALSKAQRDKLTPDDIIALMRKGNERFRRGEESPAQLPRAAGGERQGPVSSRGHPELHRFARAGRDDHGSGHRRLLQCARGGQHRQ